MSKVAIIDCQVAGIAGDMLVSALVDAGSSRDRVIDAILTCGRFLKGSEVSKVSFDKVTTHGFSATRLSLKYNDGVHERTGAEMIDALENTCDALALKGRTRKFAHDALLSIISAEASIHGENRDSVHLHEASSVDTLADIVGCAVALEDLGLFDAQVYSSRVAVGAGTLKFSHGKVPNPADAILHILGKRFVLEGGQVEDELATPTGAALLANIAQKSIDFYPPLITEKIGYGAGNKEFAGFANLVRVTIGEAPSAVNKKDAVCLVETNLDDVTGEVLGNLIERLTDLGAKDVTILTGTGKKGRPTHLVRVICDNSLQNAVLDLLFGETGTLGARVQHVDRVILSRAVLTLPVKIAGNTFSVLVKVAKDARGNVRGAKAEFEDIKIIAARCGLPVRRVAELVNAQVTQSKNKNKSKSKMRNKGKYKTKHKTKTRKLIQND